MFLYASTSANESEPPSKTAPICLSIIQSNFIKKMTKPMHNFCAYGRKQYWRRHADTNANADCGTFLKDYQLLIDNLISFRSKSKRLHFEKKRLLAYPIAFFEG